MSPSEELFWHLEIDLFGIAIKPYEEEALPLSAAKVKKNSKCLHLLQLFCKNSAAIGFFSPPFLP